MNLEVIQSAFFETGNSLDFIEQGFWSVFPALKVGPFDSVEGIAPIIQPIFDELDSNLGQFIQTINNQITELFDDVEELELPPVLVEVFGQSLEFVKTLIEYDFYLS